MMINPRVALIASVAVSLIAASVSTRAEEHCKVDEPCCCDESDSTARAAMITGGTFITVGWAVSIAFGLAGSSTTNRYLSFIPLAGPLAMATNSHDDRAAVGALIFSVWSQAVGVMVMALGATQRRRPAAERVSFGAGPTPGGVVGSIAVQF